VVVRNLQPGTTYLLRITAKNEVGFGNYEQLRVTTKSLSKSTAVGSLDHVKLLLNPFHIVLVNSSLQ